MSSTTTTTATASAPAPPSPDVPGASVIIDALSSFRDLVVVGPEQRVFWFIVALIAVGSSWFLSRGLKPRGGRLGALIGVATSVARAIALILVAALTLSLIPAWLAPALVIALGAAAAALGWSLRDVLPDLVASVWLLIERRVQAGASIVGGPDEGVIERLGLRSTWVRTPDGRRRVVPNRSLLASSLQLEPPRWPRVRVELDLELELRESLLAPEQIRSTIKEAVLTSAWVPVEPETVVERSTRTDGRWTVAARLVSLEHRARFEGELRERVQAFLQVERETARRG